MATLSGLIGTSFIGSQGPQGIQGLQGTQGIQGIQGTNAIPQNAQTTSYTLVASDVGKHIAITTGGVTVPASVFNTGDAISIYNNSGSSQTITQGASVTLRNAGTASTGNRTLAQYGLATVLCVGTNTFLIAGVGIS